MCDRVAVYLQASENALQLSVALSCSALDLGVRKSQRDTVRKREREAQGRKVRNERNRNRYVKRPRRRRIVILFFLPSPPLSSEAVFLCVCVCVCAFHPSFAVSPLLLTLPSSYAGVTL